MKKLKKKIVPQNAFFCPICSSAVGISLNGCLRERSGFSKKLGLKHIGWVSHMEAWPLKGKLGFPRLTGRAGPLTGRLGLSQGGKASHREAGLPSLRGLASHSKAWPGFSKSASKHSSKPEIQSKT